MLFVSSIVTIEGASVLKDQCGSDHSYQMSLSLLVAKIFDCHTGENLNISDVHVPHWVTDPNWPVPWTVILAVAHSNTRVMHFDPIEDELQRTIRAWHPGLATAQAKLVFAKKPEEMTVVKGRNLKPGDGWIGSTT